MTEQEKKFWLDHRLETYKSMISISVEGFKYLALLNGGAAAGLMSGLNALKQSVSMCALKVAIACFALGLILNCVAFFGSYFTQNAIFNESIGQAKSNAHVPYFLLATIFCILSIVAFGLGCLSLIVGVH
ncbi:hypothetical protein [Herbaspirillum sp. SJZ099]|uniref:hypothetical protein n=1 Tax=Herbaspirillum sp. SJZ099 TaxID=2572916 RepID=UPI0011AAC733|nr:hypothetical protein [Herbaspirillum sp. SJZ099]